MGQWGDHHISSVSSFGRHSFNGIAAGRDVLIFPQLRRSHFIFFLIPPPIYTLHLGFPSVKLSSHSSRSLQPKLRGVVKPINNRRMYPHTVPRCRGQAGWGCEDESGRPAVSHRLRQAGSAAVQFLRGGIVRGGNRGKLVFAV